VVERHELVRGFEYSKGKFATFTEAELHAIEAEANKNIDLKEFVPVSAVDPVYFESAYYLGPDEGGEKPYRLLAIALAKTQRAAVAKLVSRGKEQIVMIRPYRGGLVLPTLGKGLLSECPATSLNRKNTAASTACESWRWSMQKSKAAKSSPRSSPASRRRSSTSWIEAEHEEGSREKSCQRSQGAEDSVKGLTAPANKGLGMDPTMP